MRNYYDYIYLSPHLDDVVFSCGVQIFQHTSQGKSVMIITLMAGDPDPNKLGSHAQILHKRWRLGSNAVAIRRREDLLACAYIGADTLHWPYLDCIYRRNPQTGEHVYQTDPSLFGPIDPSESDLVSNLSARMMDLPSHGEVLAPLGLGNHVDHKITRQAATLTMDEAKLSFYEEFPYVIRDSEQLPIYESDVDWKSELIAVSPDALATRIQAMSIYQSQLSTFFEGGQDLYMQVEDYVRNVGGERIWRQVRLE
jgi:LmbE family N-acetylglucosaminyl deacetylase